MSPGAKVFMALLGAGAVIGVIAVAAKPAKAAAPGQPKQPKPSNAPPDVIVPEPGTAIPGVSLPTIPGFTPPAQSQGGTPPAAPAPPPFFPPVPPLPSFTPPAAAPGPSAAPPSSAPQAPAGTTITLPNPLGGAPLGTFNPATGSVFGPNGVIVGTFNPATGLFTATNGMQVTIPGFGSGAPPVVPAPPFQAAPVPSVPSGAATPAAPPPQAAAPVTTVLPDTAAMVSALLQAEALPGWNKTDPTVVAWQRARPPLVVDGKFGPKSALSVAASLGTVPLVRFWALNGVPKATQLANYQASLIQLANASPDPVRASQLRAAAQREQAQAFSTHGPLPPIPITQQVQVQQVA